VKWQVELLPASSVAEQLTVVVPNAKALPEAGVQPSDAILPQTAVADGVYVVVAEPLPVHSRVRLAGQERTGGSEAWTVTWKLHDELLPAPSVAVQFTVVVPSPKLVPDGGVQEMAGLGSQASVAVAVKFVVAPPLPVQASVRSAGQVISGAWVSRTITWNVHSAVFSDSSVAVQVTVLVPAGNT
jgi:hypothetical protein